MDDLFEKLKSEPPVDNSKLKDDIKSSPKKDITEDVVVSPKRKTSISSRSNSIGSNKDDDDEIKITNNDIKSTEPIDEQPKKAKKRSASKSGSEDEKIEATEESPKKVMPTKAQQKLFETSPVDLADEKTATNNGKNMNMKIKRFRIRIKRENLVELRENFARERAKLKSKRGNKTTSKENKRTPSPTKATSQKSGSKRKIDDDDSPSPKKTTEKAGNKRKAETGDSPPSKKGKKDTTVSPPGKKNKSSGFFIKLNNSVKKTPQSPKEKVARKVSPRGSTSTPVYVTKATKFTRSQLIRSFGKRYFNSHVRIERCRHPMMLTFESNARARKLQAKNKSKNLSVSFKEQVEIIGLSDSESNDSDDVDTTTSKTDAPVGVGATPLHLKKVENGKVVDDIEFDPKLFGDPKSGSNSSTPLRKKKTERKSYSPLKDDSSSTARSELLKSANEKLPPSALLRLSADEEDDEDDECEWIVPIDLPERRLSRTNSLTQDGKTTTETEKTDKVNSTAAENQESDKINKTTSSAEIKKDEVTVEKEIESSETKTVTPTIDEKIEQINGNATSEENKNSEENSAENESPEEKQKENKNSQLKDENDKIDTPLSFENDSTSVTPNPSFTPENQETSDFLVKNALDKLSEDIEKSESDEINKETTSVNKIAEDKTSSISA